MVKNLLSINDAAKILGVSRIAVYKKIKSGKIKAIKVGRNFVIEKKDLPKIFSSFLTEEKRKLIEKSVEKTVKEYGETLKLLGKE